MGLALAAGAFTDLRDLLPVAAIVLLFDLVVGLTTFGRIIRASYEDYLAVQGMTRIRHGMAKIAPVVRPYLSAPIHDDLVGVMAAYGDPPTKGVASVIHQLTTSAGMVGLIRAPRFIPRFEFLRRYAVRALCRRAG